MTLANTTYTPSWYNEKIIIYCRVIFIHLKKYLCQCTETNRNSIYLALTRAINFQFIRHMFTCLNVQKHIGRMWTSHLSRLKEKPQISQRCERNIQIFIKRFWHTHTIVFTRAHSIRVGFFSSKWEPNVNIN